MNGFPQVEGFRHHGLTLAVLHQLHVLKLGEGTKGRQKVRVFQNLLGQNIGIVHGFIVRAHILGEYTGALVAVIGAAIHVEDQEGVDPPLVRVFTILCHVERLNGNALRTMSFVELVDCLSRISVCFLATIGSPMALNIGVHSNTIDDIAIPVLFLQYFLLDPLDLKHQGRGLLAGLATGTLFICAQLFRRPVVPASGTAEVRQTSQATRLRGIDEIVTSHSAGLTAPDNTAIRVLFDLAQVDLSDVSGGTPADALDVIAVEDMDLIFAVLILKILLCQVSLELIRQSLNAVMLPHLTIPPSKRAFGILSSITNVEVVLSTYSSQATQRDTVAVVIHGIGDDESDVGLVQVHMTCCFGRCCDTGQGATIDDDTFVCHNTWPF